MKRSILLYWAVFLLGSYLAHVFYIDGQKCLRYGLILLTISAMLKLYSMEVKLVFFSMALMAFGSYLYGSDYQIQTLPSGEVNNIRGVIVEERYGDKDYERYVIRLTGQYNYKNDRLILTLYENTELEVGNEIVISGTIEEFKSNRNPKLYSSKNKYKSEYIHNNLLAKKRDISLVGDNGLNYIEGLANGFKLRVVDIVDQNIGQKDSPLLKSMILGDSTYMEEDELSVFRDIGLGHIIAVSGLHIGIIFGSIYVVLGRLLGIHRRLGQLVAIIVVWIYIAMIGFPLSSVRAAILVSGLIGSKVAYKRYDSLDMIGLTGLIMIIYKPLWAINLGYQLSFTGALFLAIANEKKLSPLLAIFMGLLPLNIFYFNRLALVSLLSNILLVPILSLGLLLGIGMVVGSHLPVPIDKILAPIIEVLFTISGTISEFLSSGPMYIELRSPSMGELIFLYILIMVAMGIIDISEFDPKLIQIFIVYSLIVSLSLIDTEKTRVDFLDVGQGDCSIITIGDKNYMIDSGGSEFSNYDIGEHVVYPYLKKRGIKKLDAFIVSHYHADHLKGFNYIAENMEVERIIIGYKSPENQLYRDLLETARRESIDLVYIGKEKLISVDKNNQLYFLPRTEENLDLGEDNDNSLAVLLESYGHRVLFTGDMESEGERDLIDTYGIRSIDVLKVPHHGSSTSSSQAFLESLSPRLSIIQVGENNYGHPNLEVLDRYRHIKSRVYRNDISGMVELSLEADSLILREFLSEKKTPYHMIRDNIDRVYILMVHLSLWLIMVSEYGKYQKAEENKGEYELQRVFKYHREGKA